jgi:hypothetical protein
MPTEIAVRNRFSGLPPTATHLRVWMYANTTDTAQDAGFPRTDQAECPVSQCTSLVMQPIRRQGNQVREEFGFGSVNSAGPIVDQFSDGITVDLNAIIEAAFGAP